MHILAVRLLGLFFFSISIGMLLLQWLPYEWVVTKNPSTVSLSSTATQYLLWQNFKN